MEKRDRLIIIKIVTLTVLYIIVCFSYFRFVILQSSALPGESSTSDFYFSFFVWREQLAMLQQGFVPFGTYWLSRYIGGIPISLTPFNGWQDLPNLFATAMFAVTGNCISTLRLMILGSSIISFIFSYMYGQKITKSHDASMISSVGYSFSIQHFADLHYGHLNLLVGFALIPFVLLVWERQLETPSSRNSIFACASLVLLFLVEWQCLFFVGLFLILRFLWFLRRSRPYANDLVKLTTYTSMSGVMFILFVVPFFAFTSYYYGVIRNVESLVGVPVAYYFIRPSILRFGWDIPYNYVGLILLCLLFVPLLAGDKHDTSERKLGKQYIFFLLAALFFFCYSSAGYAPVDIATLIYEVLPFASAIRVVGRSAILVYLCTSMCCSIGYLKISRYLSSTSWIRLETGHRRFTLKPLKKSLPILICVILFADITFGFEPVATDPYVPSSAAYDFVREQRGEFRVMEIPQFYGQATTTSSYIGHEVLDFRPLYLTNTTGFIDIYRDFANFEHNLFFIDHGRYESNPKHDWSVSFPERASFNVERIKNSSSQRRSILMISLNSSRLGDYVKLERTIDRCPEITDDLYFSIRIMMEPPNDCSVDALIECEDSISNRTTIRYRLAGDDKKSSFENQCITVSLDDPGKWNLIQRNLSADLNAYGIYGKCHIRGIHIIVRDGTPRGEQANTKVLIDHVAIYRRVDTFTRATLYGVKYLVINADQNFLKKWSKIGIMSLLPIQNAVMNIQSYVELMGDFRLVYEDEDVYVYENTHFRGLVFPVKLNYNGSMTDIDVLQFVDSSVNYSRADPNTLIVLVEAREPCMIIVSQNYFDGWKATDKGLQHAIGKIMGTCSVYLEQGSYNLVLHFEPYEESLLLFPFFHALILNVLVMQSSVNSSGREGRKKFVLMILVAYSLFLIAISLFGLHLFGVTAQPGILRRALLWLGLSINLTTALIILLFSGGKTKILSIQSFALMIAFLSLTVGYLMRDQNGFLFTTYHWPIFIASLTTTALVSLVVTGGARALTWGPSLYDSVIALKVYGSHVARLLRCRYVIILLKILATTAVVITMFTFRNVGPVWENNVFRGYALYLTQFGRLSMILSAVMGIAFTRFFWPDRKRELLSTQMIVPVSNLIVAVLSLRVYQLAGEYIFVSSSNFFQNMLFFTLLAIFLTDSILVIHVTYGPIVIGKRPTLDDIILRPPMKVLGLLMISFSFVGSVIHDEESVIAQLFGYGSFYLLLIAAFIHLLREADQDSSGG